LEEHIRWLEEQARGTGGRVPSRRRPIRRRVSGAACGDGAPSWPRISGQRNLCARCSTTSTLIGGNIARSTSPSTDHDELPPAGRATTRRLDPDGHAPRRRRARDTRQASWVNRSRTPAGRLRTPARSAGTIRPRAPQAGSTPEPSRLGRRPPSRAVGQLTTDRDPKGSISTARQPAAPRGGSRREIEANPLGSTATPSRPWQASTTGDPVVTRPFLAQPPHWPPTRTQPTST
jgi:hypothetical protein